MDYDHESTLDKFRLCTCSVNHFYIQQGGPVSAGKIDGSPGTTWLCNFSMTWDLLLKNIVAQRPI